jgi:hypothetical protein
MVISKYDQKIPTAHLLADLRGIRKGIKYARGGMTKGEMLKELSRRKKLGLVRKDAGKSKIRRSRGLFG